MITHALTSKRRRLRLVLALGAGSALAMIPLTAASANVNPHGANSLEVPRVFVDFWGPQWQSGFSTPVPGGGSFSSGQYQLYLLDFLRNLSTDPGPLDPLMQYGFQTAAGFYSGSWTDTGNSPPASPSVDQLGAEVSRAAAHFGDVGSGQDVNDIIIIAMPSGHDPNNFPSNGGNACAYHQYAQFTFGSLGPTPWVALPYEPDDLGCYGYSTNRTGDAFGHGYLDNVSMAAFHEISEAITNYDLQYGWYDDGGNEVGDLCTSYTGNYGAPGYDQYFAIQSVWSNADQACNLSTTQIVALSGNVSFGDQAVGQPAATRTVTVSNTGDGDFYLGPGSPWLLLDSTGSYSLTGNTCPLVLHPSQSCQVKVEFAPRTTGQAAARLVFLRRYTAPYQQVSLTGIGTRSRYIAVAVSDRSPRVFVSGKAAIEKITLTSLGKRSIAFKPGSVVGDDAADFTVTSSSCATLPARHGATCAVDVRFAPKATGRRQGELLLHSSAGTFAVVVGGTAEGATAAVSSADLHSGTLSFLTTDDLGDHPSEPVTLTAGGQSPLRIGSVSATGSFTAVSKCPKVLRPGKSCVIRVVLDATRYNAQSGTLTITDSASPARQQIALRGDVEGTWAQAYPAVVDFGAVPVDTVSTMQVHLSGPESAPFDIRSVRASGGFSVKNGCPAVLLFPSCTITVAITPLKAGSKFSGTLTVATNARNGTLEIPLSAYTS